MGKTKIEWCDYTVNPVKGLCPMACPYCYARAMYKRFKWNPEIRWQSGTGQFLRKLKQPSRIFVGSTIELFGEWINPEWMWYIFKTVILYPEHTFIFLTKQPQNLIKFSPFPENAWVGVTATEHFMFIDAVKHLKNINANVKYISFEPLKGHINPTADIGMETLGTNILKTAGINWVIIGSQTKPTVMPKIEWVEEICHAASKAGIPVFIKNNLKPLYEEHYNGVEVRQEMPSA